MFEQSLILRAGLDKGIDVGLLAETLFFYGSTHILLDSRSVLALARIIPSGDLIALLDRNAIKISYLRQQFVVLTGGMPAVHDFGAVTLHRTGLGKPRLDYREEIQFALERGFGSTRQTKKLARAIADRVKLHRFSDNENREKSITDS